MKTTTKVFLNYHENILKRSLLFLKGYPVYRMILYCSFKREEVIFDGRAEIRIR